MSYIGRVEQKASDIKRFDVTSSTSATHTLSWSPVNEQSCIVTINGVKQHEDAYSVSGTTLTLKKLDGSTTAATFTLNDGTNPTSLTRST